MCVCRYIYMDIYIHTYCQDDVDELVLQCQELLLQSYTHVCCSHTRSCVGSHIKEHGKYVDAASAMLVYAC